MAATRGQDRAGSDTPPAAVLDTNVVLDWLVFGDAGAAALGAAIESGTVRWLACGTMRAEFERTLAYRTLAKRQPDRGRLLRAFDRHARLQAAPATLPALRCTDADDQVFLDLAAAAGARWLVTHDRALLRLARRAQALGVVILRAGAWPGIAAAP